MNVSRNIFLIFFVVFLTAGLGAQQDPIDVVIPAHEKDIRTLNLVVEGIRKFGKDVRRIIVVSAKPLTKKAEWFDEKNYPFTKNDLLLVIFNNNQQQVDDYLQKPNNRIGWIYQQMLKLYASYVIPEISSNVLILDSDTIFLRPISFIDDEGYALYNVGTEYETVYFKHGERLLPGFHKVFPNYSGICHHMLFQKCILDDLFRAIINVHGCEPWQALCKCMDKDYLFSSALSEYELYFNFAFLSNYKVKIRHCKWLNMKFNLHEILFRQKEGYDYVSCHAYMG